MQQLQHTRSWHEKIYTLAASPQSRLVNTQSSSHWALCYIATSLLTEVVFEGKHTCTVSWVYTMCTYGGEHGDHIPRWAFWVRTRVQLLVLWVCSCGACKSCSDKRKWTQSKKRLGAINFVTLETALLFESVIQVQMPYSSTNWHNVALTSQTLLQRYGNNACY